MKYTIAALLVAMAMPAFADNNGNNGNGNGGFDRSFSFGAFASTQGGSFAANEGNGLATQETFGSSGQFSSFKVDKFDGGSFGGEITAQTDGFSSAGSRGSFEGNAGNFGVSESFNQGFSFGSFGGNFDGDFFGDFD